MSLYSLLPGVEEEKALPDLDSYLQQNLAAYTGGPSGDDGFLRQAADVPVNVARGVA